MKPAPDIKLGDLDGITLAKKIIGMKKDIKITADGFWSLCSRDFELNAVDYVLKPFWQEQLAEDGEKNNPWWIRGAENNNSLEDKR